jgi:hypothetical protein
MLFDFHCMLVQQALVGSASGEEQLFSSESSLTRDGIACELDVYLEKIKVCNFLCFPVLVDAFFPCHISLLPS